MKKTSRLLCLLLATLMLSVPALAAPSFQNTSGWAQENMQEAYSLGWITEKTVNRAQEPITKGELCTMAVRFYQDFTGNSGVTMKTYHFSDDGDSQDVAFVVEKDILTPLDAGTFGYGVYVTRQEMAQFLKNLLEVSGVHLRDAATLKLNFQDSWQISAECADAVKLLSDAGVAAGYGDRFYPLSNVTVEQAVTMLLAARQVFQPQPLTLGDLSLRIGDDAANLTAKLGQPGSKWKNEYGFERYFYQVPDKGFLMVGVQNGKIAELYSNAAQLSFRGLTAGSVSKDADFLNFDSNRVYVGTASAYEAEIQVLFDPGNSGKLDGVYLRAKSLTKAATVDAADSARCLWEMVNAARIKRGAPALLWDDVAAATANAHSSELAFATMANYTNKLGETPFQRMSRNGIEYVMAAENISVSNTNTIDILFDWMQNTGARGNLLEPALDHAGIGIYPQQDKLITTIDLFEAR